MGTRHLYWILIGPLFAVCIQDQREDYWKKSDFLFDFCVHTDVVFTYKGKKSKRNFLPQSLEKIIDTFSQEATVQYEEPRKTFNGRTGYFWKILYFFNILVPCPESESSRKRSIYRQ
jgi:hypothetical protein